MKSHLLTALKVKSLTQRGWYADGQNLYLQVSATGSKSWALRYKLNGKQRWMGLGSASVLSLSDARLKAHELRLRLIDEIDPIDERKSQRRSATKSEIFSECAKKYIASHQTDWKNAKHQAQWANTLKTYAEPVLGAMPVSEIDVSAVMRVLEPIWASKTETATRVNLK
jgi:hypothetical protein